MASAAEQLASNLNFSAFAKAEDLKKRLWFTVGALVVFRLCSFVPLPGIDLITDVAVLLALLGDINRRFGLTEAQVETLSPSRKALAYKLTTAAGGFFATRMATSQVFLTLLRRAGPRLGIMEATRFAPIVGPVVAALIAYFTLTRIARRHVEQCAEIAARLSG